MKQTIVTAVLVASIFLLGLSMYIALSNEPTYTYGKVIAADQDLNRIEVQIEEDGPRIFVDDLGPYSVKDLKFGDLVDLKFENRYYRVLKIREDIEK